MSTRMGGSARSASSTMWPIMTLRSLPDGVTPPAATARTGQDTRSDAQAGRQRCRPGTVEYNEVRAPTNPPRLCSGPGATSVSGRRGRQTTFVANRLRPGDALGLLLTGQLAVLVVLGIAFGTVFDNVTENDDLAALDPAVSSDLIGTRQPWLNQFFEVVTWAGSGAVLFPLVLVTGLWLHHVSRDWRPFVLLVGGLGGAVTISTLIKLAVARPRPAVPTLVHAVGYAFPSGHSTAAAAGWLGLALVLSVRTSRWVRKIALVSAALVVIGLVGVSRVYLGVHQATDVLGGWILGALWVLALVVALRLRDGLPSRR